MAEQASSVNKILPLVTIAIPTYNRADHYLGQALKSARNQTYSNLDIIVADNCSVDATATFVSSITDSRIRYIRHPVNIGATNNFNFCLQEAKGDYFLLLSDDDLIDDDFVETCMNSVQCDSDIGIIRTGTRVIDANDQILRESPNMVGGYSTSDFFRGWFAGKTAMYLCSTLYHTERLREIGGFRSKHNLFDDGVTMVHLAAKHRRIDIRDIKASARVHEAELSFAESLDKWCEDSLLLLNLMCELVSENKVLIRNEGMRFFSRGNYFRASSVKSPLGRFTAYMIVFKKYHYRYLPPLYPQRLHPRRLRGIKVKMKQLLNGLLKREGPPPIDSQWPEAECDKTAKRSLRSEKQRQMGTE